MDFVNKARRKVQEVVDEARNAQGNQSQGSQSQLGFPSQQQWPPNKSQYHAPTPQTASYPAYPGPPSQQQYFPPPLQQQQYYPPPPLGHITPVVVPAPQHVPYSPSQAQYYPPPQQTQHQETERVHANSSSTSPYTSGVPPEPPLRNLPVPAVPRVESAPSPLKCTGYTGLLAKYTQFFVLKSSDDFCVCKNCYQSKIVPHQGLAYDFKPYHTISENARFVCDFSLPRVQALFRDQCIPQNSTQPLLDFTKFCETLTPCDGSVITDPGPYYNTKNQAVPGLAVCPTCFEANLRCTVFEDMFEWIADGTNGGEHGWQCDLSMRFPFYRRMLANCLEGDTPSFNEFVEEAKTRLATPDCPGEGNPVAQFPEKFPSMIFTAKDGKTGNICFACYCDYLANTSLEEAFVPANLSPEQLGKVTCDLSSAFSKRAIDFAIKKGDDEIWRNAVGKAGKLGKCRGIRGLTTDEVSKERAEIESLADWYKLDEVPSVEICPPCYWLKIGLFGAAHLFSPVAQQHPTGKVLQCYLSESDSSEDADSSDPDNFENSMAWRGRRIFNSMYPGFETGDWSVLKTVSKEIDKEPPPCGGNTRGFMKASGRKWFGRVNPDMANPDDCTIVFCGECHARTVKGTPHEAHFSNDLTGAAYAAEGSTGFVCHTYTNRARTILREAAQTGDLVEFARFWNLRAELRKKKDAWKPIIEAQLLKQQMANFQQSQNLLLKVSAQGNALSRIAAAGIVEAAMSDPGERYGNSQIGTDFWTRGRADAEQEWQNANNMPGGSAGGSIGLISETQRLFILAQQDEKAFAAVE